MKKKNLGLYRITVVVGLLVIAGALTLYGQVESNSKLYAGELQKKSGEYGRLLESAKQERANDNAAALVRIRTLENRLAEETDAKTAAMDSLKDLERQFKDAAQESMGIQTNLVKNLADVTADIQGPYEVLIRRVEDLFLRNAKVNAGQSLRPIIFMPADARRPLDADKEVLAIKRALGITQVWYQNQLGVAFDLKDIREVKGTYPLSWYDNLPPRERFKAIMREVGDEQAVIVFLYGSNDRMNWGFWGGEMYYPGALINSQVIESLKSESSQERYAGIAVLAHELGHVWGLPDIVTDKKSGLIMEVDRNNMLINDIFSFVSFTERENNTVGGSLGSR